MINYIDMVYSKYSFQTSLSSQLTEWQAFSWRYNNFCDGKDFKKNRRWQNEKYNQLNYTNIIKIINSLRAAEIDKKKKLSRVPIPWNTC